MTTPNTNLPRDEQTTASFSTKLDEFVSWVTDCNGDVDADTFRQSCDDFAFQQANVRKFRVPCGVLGRGVLTLDYACSLNRMQLPFELLGFDALPGVREYHQHWA